MRFNFTHSNITVTNLERSLEFYKQALSLTEVRRRDFGDCIMAYLQDDNHNFELELRWYKDSRARINHGDNLTHLAFTTDDVQAALKKHREMKCVHFTVDELDIYFIKDLDEYIIEIMPENFFNEVK